MHWSLPQGGYIRGLATGQGQYAVLCRRIYLAFTSVDLPPGRLDSVFAETSRRSRELLALTVIAKEYTPGLGGGQFIISHCSKSDRLGSEWYLSIWTPFVGSLNADRIVRL